MPPSNAPDIGGGNPFKSLPKPVLIGGGVAALFVGYEVYKARKNAGSNAAATASPYGPPEAGTGVLNPIVIDQPSGTTPPTGGVSTPTTTPTSTSTQPSALQQANYPGVPAATLKGVNNEYLNYLIHNPAPGYTGLQWSKLSVPARISIYQHTPVNGITGISWSKLTLAQQIGQYVHRSKAPKPAATPKPITSKVA